MKNLQHSVRLILIALSFFSIQGCKKEIIPPPESNDPVFTAMGTFGSNLIQLNAGDQGVVMVSEVELVNGVPFYKGVLGNGSTEIELGIFPGNLDIETQNTPDFLNITEIQLAELMNGPLVEVSKDSLPNHEAFLSIDWTLTDNNGTSQPMNNNLVISKPGRYNVCAVVTFNDYSTKTICNELLVGYQKNADFTLNFYHGPTNNLQVWVDESLGEMQSVKWFDNETYVGSSSDLSMNLDSNSHLIRAEVTFTNGAKLNRTILIDGTLNGKNFADFTHLIESNFTPWDFKAKVKVKKDGITYFSENTSNSSNKITIQETKYHGISPQGKHVYLIKGMIQSNLKSASGIVLPLDLQVSLGIAVN